MYVLKSASATKMASCAVWSTEYSLVSVSKHHTSRSSYIFCRNIKGNMGKTSNYLAFDELMELSNRCTLARLHRYLSVIDCRAVTKVDIRLCDDFVHFMFNCVPFLAAQIVQEFYDGSVRCQHGSILVTIDIM